MNWINEPGRVFVARQGRSELTNVILTAPQVADLVERMLRTSGRRIDLSAPFVEAMLRKNIGWGALFGLSSVMGSAPRHDPPRARG